MTPTVILTRPKAQSERFADELIAQWGGALAIIHAPLIKIVPVAASCAKPDGVIFTSANGVSAAKRLGLPKGLAAWCVGSKTAELARAAGFVPTTGPGDAAGLVSTIIAAKPSGKFAHIRGKHARGDVSARLNAAGIRCEDVVAYDQVALSLTSEAKSVLSAQQSVIFPLFSPRTASILNNAGPFVAEVHIVALSEVVRQAVAPEMSQQITLATAPNGKAMLLATLQILKGEIRRR